MVCELLRIGAPQGQHNWWTEGIGWSLGAGQKTLEIGWRLGNCEECDSDMAPIPTKPQEGRKVKPIPLSLLQPGRPAELAWHI